MIVRTARVEDAGRIADIHVGAWHAAYADLVPASLLAKITKPAKEASWLGALSSGKTRILVAEDNNGIQAWCQFGKARDLDATPEVGEVYAMYVDPATWRRGVGRSLWSATLTDLRQGFSCATLWVIEANAPARRFYEQCGFSAEPESVDKPDWLGVNRIRYRQPIGEAGKITP